MNNEQAAEFQANYCELFPVYSSYPFQANYCELFPVYSSYPPHTEQFAANNSPAALRDSSIKKGSGQFLSNMENPGLRLNL